MPLAACFDLVSPELVRQLDQMVVVGPFQLKQSILYPSDVISLLLQAVSRTGKSERCLFFSANKNTGNSVGKYRLDIRSQMTGDLPHLGFETIKVVRNGEIHVAQNQIFACGPQNLLFFIRWMWLVCDNRDIVL